MDKEEALNTLLLSVLLITVIGAAFGLLYAATLFFDLPKTGCPGNTSQYHYGPGNPTPCLNVSETNEEIIQVLRREGGKASSNKISEITGYDDELIEALADESDNYICWADGWSSTCELRSTEGDRQDENLF